MIVSQTTARWQ